MTQNWQILAESEQEPENHLLCVKLSVAQPPRCAEGGQGVAGTQALASGPRPCPLLLGTLPSLKTHTQQTQPDQNEEGRDIPLLYGPLSDFP